MALEETQEIAFGLRPRGAPPPSRSACPSRVNHQVPSGPWPMAPAPRCGARPRPPCIARRTASGSRTSPRTNSTSLGDLPLSTRSKPGPSPRSSTRRTDPSRRSSPSPQVTRVSVAVFSAYSVELPAAALIVLLLLEPEAAGAAVAVAVRGGRGRRRSGGFRLRLRLFPSLQAKSAPGTTSAAIGRTSSTLSLG